jgi:hypothetical protein
LARDRLAREKITLDAAVQRIVKSSSLKFKLLVVRCHRRVDQDIDAAELGAYPLDHRLDLGLSRKSMVPWRAGPLPDLFHGATSASPVDNHRDIPNLQPRSQCDSGARTAVATRDESIFLQVS